MSHEQLNLEIDETELTIQFTNLNVESKYVMVK